MTREEAHELIDRLFDEADAGVVATGIAAEDGSLLERELPEGKRVVRTKSSGDRVYCLDEVAKTRQWVTNPDVLAKLGFEISDVVEVDDNELLSYQMGPALYKVED